MYRYGLTFKIYKEGYLPYMFIEDSQGIQSLFTDGKRSLIYFPQIKKLDKADSLFFIINNGKIKRLSYEESINAK
jgi:hypothetical protein